MIVLVILSTTNTSTTITGRKELTTSNKQYLLQRRSNSKRSSHTCSYTSGWLTSVAVERTAATKAARLYTAPRKAAKAKGSTPGKRSKGQRECDKKGGQTRGTAISEKEKKEKKNKRR